MSEISTIKHTSSLPYIPLACLSTLQPRAKQDRSVGLFPQWFPAECKEKEAAHLDTEGTREVLSTGSRAANGDKEPVGKEELRLGLTKQED